MRELRRGRNSRVTGFSNGDGGTGRIDRGHGQRMGIIPSENLEAEFGRVLGGAWERRVFVLAGG